MVRPEASTRKIFGRRRRVGKRRSGVVRRRIRSGVGRRKRGRRRRKRRRRRRRRTYIGMVGMIKIRRRRRRKRRRRRRRSCKYNELDVRCHVG